MACVFALVAFFFFYKLDYAYFFTDEILYVQRGAEHLLGIYTDTLQVPLLPKYLAGIVYRFVGQDAFLLRAPFALMGVITAFLIYLILKREFGEKFGLAGVLLFVTSRIIIESTRMVMLEPMMHLFWLAFHYFYYQTFSSTNRRIFLLAGVFLGLSLSVKISAFVLLPFIFLCFTAQIVHNNSNRSQIVKNHILMLVASLLSAAMWYIHFFYKLGVVKGVVDTLRAVKDTYFLKSETGKTHVIGTTIYEYSPWWTYFYYHVFYNGWLRSVVYMLFAPLSLFSRDRFAYYWGTFLLLVFSFHQMSGVKNFRYISSIEIPIIMLTVSGFVYLYSKQRIKKYVLILLAILLSLSVGRQMQYLVNLEPTEYLGLFNYFKKETNNFTENKRLIAFGSVRSMKWYREQVPNEDMFIYRKDYHIICPELPAFEYFAFDKEEILKDPTNFLYSYVRSNKANFQQIHEVKDMLIYKRLRQFDSLVSCPI